MTHSVSLRASLALVFLSVAACGQIVCVEIRDDKAKSKYGAFVQQREGKWCIVGEPISGIEIRADGSVAKDGGAKEVTMIVADPAKPDLLISEITPKGTRKIVAKNRETAIQSGDEVTNGYRVCIPGQTLNGLRTEFLRKREAIEERRAAMKGLKVGSQEWFAVHRALLVEVDGLVSWLRATIFPVAADRMAKEYGAELKREGDVGSKSRLESAKMVKQLQVPAELTEASAKIGQSSLRWHGRESQHFRMWATEVMAGGQLEASLILAERILESFRTLLIDPYLGPEGKDPVAEGVFHEFFLAPADEEVGTKFLEQYFGQRVGEPRDKAIKVASRRFRSKKFASYMSFSRFDPPGRDLEGFVAHHVGHVLANVAYYDNSENVMPAWIEEGFGYWVSFEHLSRNTDYCIAFKLDNYARLENKDKVQFTDQGLRASFNQLALDRGPPFERMLRVQLHEMENVDIAKAWSVIDWLISAERDKLGPFLRACCAESDRMGVTNTAKNLRASAGKIFGVESGKDVYAVLEDAWRKYAGTTQKSK